MQSTGLGQVIYLILIKISNIKVFYILIDFISISINSLLVSFSSICPSLMTYKED